MKIYLINLLWLEVIGPPCRNFTSKLAETYKEAQITTSSSFRLVFVSCDRDQDLFNEYHSTMSWPVVRLKSGTLLKHYFQFSSKLIFS